MDKDIREFAKRVSYLIPLITREVFKKELRQLDIGKVTFPQMILLEFLREKGDCRMKDIAQNFSITTSAATGLVDRMVKSHLLERLPDLRDRRVISVRMTKKGRDIINKVAKKKQDLMVKLFGKLSRKERETYLNILEKIYSILMQKEK